MRITLVISTLGGGGAERVAVNLAHGLVGQGHQLAIITFSGAERSPYELPPGLHPIGLDLLADSTTPLQAIRNNARRLLALRRAIRATKPHVVISFMVRTNVLVLLSMKRTSIPVIVTEHVDPREFPCGRIWEMLRRQHYRSAACVVSVSHSVDEYFSGVSNEKRRVIHNPLLIDRTLANVGFRWPDAAKRHVVGIGRLTHQKGFDLLIKAYAQVAGRHPDWALHIFGEGEERSALLALIAKLGLESKVTLPGWLDNPYSMLGASDLLVMSSRYEGFGNVLCEAMACGVPVVSFDCPSGPSDIIRHGEDGLLVPAQDVEGLASAMDRLMSDEGERRALGARAPVSMRRFDLASILPQWEALLDELVTSASGA